MCIFSLNSTISNHIASDSPSRRIKYHNNYKKKVKKNRNGGILRLRLAYGRRSNNPAHLDSLIYVILNICYQRCRMILALNQNINVACVMTDARNSVILEPKQQPVYYFLHGTSIFYFSHGAYLLNKFLIYSIWHYEMMKFTSRSNIALARNIVTIFFKLVKYCMTVLL